MDSNVIPAAEAPAAEAPAAVANAAKEYEYAIFFDNEVSRIQEVEQYCKNIQCVKVDETERLRELKFTDPIYIAFLAEKGIDKTNQYYNYISSVAAGDTLDLLSGINSKEVETLSGWIKETKGKRAAIFDWDRTLTVFEGYFGDQEIGSAFGIPHVVSKEKYQNDKLIYLMGGQERLNKIREMFELLYKNNIDVFILTNNGACQRGEFDVMINYLLPDPKTYQKICSKLYNPPKGHKGEALRQHAMFKTICAPEVGAAGGAGGGAAYGGAGAKAGGTRRRLRNRKHNRKQRKSRRSNRK